jgi:ABC-2 type transport system permease protein
MTFSVKRAGAIFEKDLKDLSKNMYVLTCILMPLFVAMLLGKTQAPSVSVHYMAINLIFTAVATFLQGTLIAEEKEMNTLRGLMLSPASTT